VIVTRSRWPRAALLLAAACWLGAALATPRPVNPSVSGAATLEAHARVPAEVRAVLREACADCHSDDTRWPWYSRVFPVSWLMTRHVRDGRAQLNLSRWSGYSLFERADLLDEMCIRTGAHVMPPRSYQWLHQEAALSAEQVRTLCAWTSREVERIMGDDE
jgi:hypothetical protein